jgi:hypothetical protein
MKEKEKFNLNVFCEKLNFIKYDYDEDYYFCDLFSPGTIIKLKNGKYYLMGDINYNFGGCNCCTAFYRDEIESYFNLYDYLEIKGNND